jgi:recombination associated protein RdgC
MGLLSSAVSITRYTIKDDLSGSVVETVAKGLKQNTVREIDDDTLEKSVGWTSFENPFNPDFDGSSFSIGPYLIFSLRIDKKNIASKTINKHLSMEVARRLQATDRTHMSRNEKKNLKEQIQHNLALRIPSTPNVYDLIWHYEKKLIWFFSNLKAANEELETLFSKSFKLNLVRLFPYTTAELAIGLSDKERDDLTALTPSTFID